MSFFINDAFAANAVVSQGDNIYSFVMVGVIFVLFYFMLIRPQNQKAKAQRALNDSLKKGDEVMLSAGMLGKIVTIDEQYVKICIAQGCEVMAQRQAVSAILPKGTLKSID